MKTASVYSSSILSNFLSREITILKYAFFGWRQSDPEPDDQRTFSCYKESEWKGFLIAILFLIGFESVPVQLFLGHIGNWFLVLHAFFAVYGILWLLGDYQAVKKSLIELETTGLRVRLGLRSNYFIPYNQIESAHLGEPKELEESGEEIQMGQFVSTKKLTGYGVISLMGKANLHLKLKSEAEIPKWPWRMKAIKTLGLFVDSPVTFVKSLQQQIG